MPSGSVTTCLSTSALSSASQRIAGQVPSMVITTTRGLPPTVTAVVRLGPSAENVGPPFDAARICAR